MKKCFKCGKEKPINDFYKHKAMADGHLGKCKDCSRSDVQKNYRKHIDNFKEYDRRRNKTEKRAQQRIDNQRRRRNNRPETYIAYQLVQRAVKNGTLQKTPCVMCGEKTVEAHHPDYSKPLDVVWLCFDCHRMMHGNGKLVGNY